MEAYQLILTIAISLALPLFDYRVKKIAFFRDLVYYRLLIDDLPYVNFKFPSTTDC